MKRRVAALVIVGSCTSSVSGALSTALCVWPPDLRPPGHYLLMPFMYILECSDRSLYVGSTWDLNKRLIQHEEGMGAAYTRTRLPVKLLYFEDFGRIEDAFRREKQVQGWGRAKRLALIKGQVEKLPGLSLKVWRAHNSDDPPPGAD